MEDLPQLNRFPLPHDLDTFMAAVEREILLEALTLHRYNRTRAGLALGLSLRQMRYRMERLGITRASLRDLLSRQRSVTSSQLFVGAVEKVSLEWPEIRG